jgi:hypothetical protein
MSKTITALPPMHEAMLNMTPGVTIVVSNSIDVLEDACKALTEQSLQAASDTGLKFPDVRTVRSFIAGSERQLKHAEIQKRFLAAPVKGTEHKLVGVGTSSIFNWCSVEGRHAILPYIHTQLQVQYPCMNIFIQEVENDKDVLVAETLIQLRAAAKAANVYVMAFLACHSGFENSKFHELCDEYAVIEKCEPDFDQDMAFSIDYLGLRSLNRFGVGKTMCSVRYADHRLQHSYAPYLSIHPQYRIIWLMRCMGKSYAEIGEAVGMDKSNVMRNLRQMPAVNRNVEIDPERLVQMLEYLQIDDEEPSHDAPPKSKLKAKLKSKSFEEQLESNNNDEDDEEGDGDDGYE